MIPLITPGAMRALEREAIASLPPLELMERAASGLASHVKGDTVYVAAGQGGNGGDGCALARILAGRGARVRVFASGEPRTEECALERSRAIEAGVPVSGASALPDDPPDAWADCLFGTGLSRAIEGDALLLARRIARDRGRGSRVTACDVPSGLDAETGIKFPGCVEADETVTFHALKTGLVLGDGPEAAGAVHVCDIGLTGHDASLFGPEDARAFYPPRRPNTHKGDYGRLLVVAGERGMAGAAALCALGAMRSGAGLVTVACVPSVLPVVQALAPCATCEVLPERDGALSPDAAPAVSRLLASRDAAAAGPGMGSGIPPEVLRALLTSGKPCVFDAGALAPFSVPEFRALLGERHLLTPHPGEAARILGRPCGSPVADALAVAGKGGAACLLKGRATVVARAGQVHVTRTGTPGMARGGSGDVLTGVAGALLARGVSPADAGCAAACAAGLAGEAAARAKGEWGMSPLDTVSCLPDAIRGLQ